MIGTRFIAAGLALLAGLALSPATRAGDTFRLDMSGPATTSTLDLRDVDTADVFDVGYRGYHGGFHGGFGRPYGGGYHRAYHGGFGRPYYGGGFGRPYYAGGFYRPYYRPLYYGGFYRPFYGAYYARPYYGGYGGYYGGDYCYPGVSYYSYSTYSTPLYYNPCSLPSPAPAVTLRVLPTTPSYQGTIVPGTVAPGTAVPSEGTIVPGTPTNPGTYPYDGGPKAPVPMPRIEDSPAPPADDNGSAIRPANERLVSLPIPDLSAANVSGTGKGKWAYPAYGEKPQRTSFAEDRPIKVGR